MATTIAPTNEVNQPSQDTGAGESVGSADASGTQSAGNDTGAGSAEPPLNAAPAGTNVTEAAKHIEAVIIPALSQEEKITLTSLEEVIEKTKHGIINAFFLIITAFCRIKAEKLYRGTHTSFEAYFNDKWGYSRSQSYRLANAGEIVQRQEASPRGDIIKLLGTESHYRPLAKRTVEQQDEVIDLLGSWIKWSGTEEVSPRMVESAVTVLYPAIEAAKPKEAKSALAEKFVAAVEVIKQKLPTDASKEVRLLFDQVKKKAVAIGNPTRTSKIDWTDATWNPLQGCSAASAGCAFCYAAKLVATRLASVYPGLASEKVGKDGKKTYVFNNIIQLLPEQLGEPLKDRTPKRYFVNSMSDLFHPKVPDDFIAAVFQVMEKAHWHQFQVLTKRPERMANFTTEYWKEKAPPAHIWLGTSTENQKAFDERYPHLLNVKAAVRWLSVEPLIGAIKFGSLEGVDWVVVGGESGSKRKMEKVWATDVRDACAEAGVPFFFKQWGEYGEDGKKLEKAKKDGLTPPSLDGVIHNAYPGELGNVPARNTPVRRGRGRPKKHRTTVPSEVLATVEAQQTEAAR